MNLTTPVSELTKVGKTAAKRLGYLGIHTAQDLLYYFPFRYEDYRRVVLIKDLRDGESVTISGAVELISNRRSFRSRKMVTEALIRDHSGSLRVVWFNQPFIGKALRPGDKVYLSGAVKGDLLGAQMVSPAYEKITSRETTSTARLVPMYALTAGLTQKQIRFLAQQVAPLAEQLSDWLPAKILGQYDLIPLPQALRGIHFPIDEAALKKSTERLKFDELLLLQLQAEDSRKNRLDHSAPQLTFHQSALQEFVGRLPFTLTKTQKIAAWEILQDIQKSTPMNRLLSGDVGSGKTVVAAMALYSAFLNGYQGVLMAPTEILAAQHFASLCRLFSGLPISIGLLTANQVSTVILNGAQRSEESLSQSINGERSFATLRMTVAKKEKEGFLKKLAIGEIKIIVGTHALLSEGVHFKKLGLVIVDEQHRFGVEQRKVIKEKSLTTSSQTSLTALSSAEERGTVTPSPLQRRGQGEVSQSAHFLSMTATPIPRSLALMLYGDLDISIISELPPGRKPIITRLVEPAKREKAYEFIRAQVKNGRQVFVVCPLIEDKQAGAIVAPLRGGGSNDKRSVLSEYDKLSQQIFLDLRVGYLHGKMKAKEKDGAMEKFKQGETDILVSTSVVEVGVDIPNASVMMIEGADKFGLAQLHQFRGRVGRSIHQSYCLLFTDSDSYRSSERLKYFETHHDGFKLAEKDLAMRGPGEVYGTEQSGLQQLRLAKLTDQGIIKKAREVAREVAPDIKKYPKLLEKIKEWERVVHLE